MTTRHLLKDKRVFRDVDSEPYQEVLSYCGAWAACSGSGEHYMVDKPIDSDCLNCIQEYRDNEKTQSFRIR